MARSFFEQLGINPGDKAATILRIVIAQAEKLAGKPRVHLLTAAQKIELHKIPKTSLIKLLSFEELPGLQAIKCVQDLCSPKELSKLSHNEARIVVGRILRFSAKFRSQIPEATVQTLLAKLRGKEVLELSIHGGLTDANIQNLIQGSKQIDKLSKEELNELVTSKCCGMKTLVEIMLANPHRLQDLENAALWRLTRGDDPKRKAVSLNTVLEAITTKLESASEQTQIRHSRIPLKYSTEQLEELFELLTPSPTQDHREGQGTGTCLNFVKLLRQGALANFDLSEARLRRLILSSTNSGRHEIFDMLIEKESLHGLLNKVLVVFTSNPEGRTPTEIFSNKLAIAEVFCNKLAEAELLDKLNESNKKLADRLLMSSDRSAKKLGGHWGDERAPTTVAGRYAEVFGDPPSNGDVLTLVRTIRCTPPRP